MYKYSQIGIKEMTNLYLFGQITTPLNLKDSALIRPHTARTTISMDAVSFMDTGAGRFALASNSPIVNKFMSSAFVDPTIIPGERKVYNLDELANLSGTKAAFSFQAYDYSDNVNDFSERVHVWSTESFTISRDAKFVIEGDGTRHIENLAVLPFDENFDFESKDDFAKYGAYLTVPSIDPSGIGRRVDIIFDQTSKDLVSRIDYTFSNFKADEIQQQQTYSPILGVARLLPEMGLVLNQLNNSDVTSFVDQGRVVRYDEFRYGYTHAPNLSDADKAIHGLTGGATMIASIWGSKLYGTEYNDELLGSDGDDWLDGSAGSDYLVGAGGGDDLQGGFGADLIYGGGGDDDLDGGDGVDSLYGGDGNDSLSGDADHHYLYGEEGDDSLDCKSDSLLDGGPGNDYLSSGANGLLMGGAGSDEYSIHGANCVIYANSDDKYIYASNYKFKLYLDGVLITEAMLDRDSSHSSYVEIGGLYISGYLDENIPEFTNIPAPRLIGQNTIQQSAIELY